MVKTAILSLLMVGSILQGPISSEDAKYFQVIETTKCEDLFFEIECQDSLTSLVLLFKLLPDEIIGLMSYDQDFKDRILAGDEEYDIIQAYGEASCEPILLDPETWDYYMPALKDPDFCGGSNSKLRSSLNTYKGSVKNSIGNVSSKKLESIIHKLEFTQGDGGRIMDTHILNDGFLQVFTPNPSKDIVLKDTNYWELVSILISIDKDELTLIIDSRFGAGVKPPHYSEYEVTSYEFLDQVEKYFFTIKQELEEYENH